MMTGENLLSYKFEQSGNSPVVLYLHGFLGCGNDWSEQILLSGNRFSHLSVDLPGHGTTPNSGFFGGMNKCVKQLIKLLDYLHIDQCHLLGYSMGGRIALTMVTQYPDRFDRIIIESGSGGLEDKAEREKRITDDNRLADLLESEGLAPFLKSWYKLPLFKTIDKSTNRFVSMIKRRQSGNPSELALALRELSTGAMPPIWNELPEIRNEILFITGSLDHKYCKLANKMADLCNDGHLTIIEGAGHNIHFEKPEKYNKIMRDFLDLR